MWSNKRLGVKEADLKASLINGTYSAVSFEVIILGVFFILAIMLLLISAEVAYFFPWLRGAQASLRPEVKLALCPLSELVQLER